MGSIRAMLSLLLFLPACGKSSGGTPTFADGGASAHGGGSAGTSAGPKSRGPWLSGSRLQARVWDGGDGARLFIGFWDQKLSVRCAFHLASDGKLRCLPGDLVPALYPAGDCSMPAYLDTGPGAIDSGYVRVEARVAADVKEPPGCKAPMSLCGRLGSEERPTTVAQIGSVTSVSQLSYNLGDCGCIQAQPEPSDSFRALQVVMPDMFVAAQVIEQGQPLAAHVLVAEDGALEVPWFVELPGELPCTLPPPSLGHADVCLPTAIASPLETPAFRSADCKVQITSIDSTCPPPRALLSTPVSQCAATVAPNVLSVGLLHPAGDAPIISYDGRDGMCLSGGSIYPPYVEVGGAFDFTQAPALTVTQQGTGRLRAGFGTEPSGYMAHNPAQVLGSGRADFTFLDTARSAPCAPRDVKDGTTRCLPEHLNDAKVTYFLDPACTLPANVVTPSMACPSAPRLFFTSAMPATPGATASVIDAAYEQGPAVAGPIYVVNEKGGGCTDSGLSSPTFLIAPLTPVDLGSFPELKQVTESAP